MSRGNRKPIGILLLIFVGGFTFLVMQGANSVTLDSAFVEKTTKFGDEFIQTYEIPVVLNEEQEEALNSVIPVFFQDELPAEFQELAEEQEREISGQRELLEEQKVNPNNTRSDINEPVETEKISEGVTHLTASKLQINRDAGDISKGLSYLEVTDNTFVRGENVRLAGKIHLNKPAPYFYNVIITCCGMNSFKAMTAVSTDQQGNFVLNIPTDRKFPLGDWTVEISTIGVNDSKIIKHIYNFKLLSDV